MERLFFSVFISFFVFFCFLFVFVYVCFFLSFKFVLSGKRYPFEVLFSINTRPWISRLFVSAYLFMRTNLCTCVECIVKLSKHTKMRYVNGKTHPHVHMHMHSKSWYLSFVPVLPLKIHYYESHMQIKQYVKCKSSWTPACAHAYALKIWV